MNFRLRFRPRRGRNDGTAASSGLVAFGRWLRGPDVVTESLQVVKAVVASTLAWWLAVHWEHTSMPFLAPWTALLTVHATAYRSLTNGVQMAIASTIGVLVSYLIGHFLGVNVFTMALALLVGVSAPYIGALRQQGVAIATTALFVLGGGWTGNEVILLDRLEEVFLGVAIGVGVNLLLIPPVRHRQAARYVDSINRRIGRIMINMADEFSDSWDTDRANAWLSETLSIDNELDSAWKTVRFARESSQWNPRVAMARFRKPASLREQRRQTGREASYEDILQRTGEGISHLRNMVRTVREATYEDSRWDDDFRNRWATLVKDAGHAIADPDAEVEPIGDRLNALARTMSAAHDLPNKYWPVYGALITSMRHIALIIDDVASARRAREADRENPGA
ncbi:FUSC family protein [Salinisphaera sp.]|uniref:FUSC family protein n=1 Tax=Salinisphaera sp. TaxID=1914330 RepID=UPI002D7789B6|nr:aromatic acid exporter family protein [Salinisphaera sp.]HET7314003.1 aromatic acid exporter family protein [Salinisphaera sp.]